jgi:hypothetical protein
MSTEVERIFKMFFLKKNKLILFSLFFWMIYSIAVCQTADLQFKSFLKLFNKENIPTVNDYYRFFKGDAPEFYESWEQYVREGVYFVKQKQNGDFDLYYQNVLKNASNTPSLFLAFLRTRIPLSAPFKIDKEESYIGFGNTAIKRYWCKFGNVEVVLDYFSAGPKHWPDGITPMFSVKSINGVLLELLVYRYLGYGKKIKLLKTKKTPMVTGN